MKINIARIQDGNPRWEPLDTAFLVGIEFVLDEEQYICAVMENGNLHVKCLTRKPQAKTKVANIITVDVTENRGGFDQL